MTKEKLTIIPVDTTKAFREKLELLCKKNNITYTQLASNIGMSTSIINKWINGDTVYIEKKTKKGTFNRESLLDENQKEIRKYTPPSYNALIKLSEYFKVSVDYLITDMECTTHTNQQIHDYTGLSDNAINTLHDLMMYWKTDDLYVINTFLDNPQTLSIIEYIKTYISDEIDGFIYPEKVTLENELPQNALSYNGKVIPPKAHYHIETFDYKRYPFFKDEKGNKCIFMYKNGSNHDYDYKLPTDMIKTYLIDKIREYLNNMIKNYKEYHEKNDTLFT